MRSELCRFMQNEAAFSLQKGPSSMQRDLARTLLSTVNSLRKDPRTRCKSGIYVHVSWAGKKRGTAYNLDAYLQPTFGQLQGQVVPVNEILGDPRQTAELLAQLIAEFESEKQIDLLFAWRIPHGQKPHARKT